MPILLNIVGAVLSFGLAALGFRELATAGFPDGHVTAYQQAASGVLTVLAAANLLLGFYFSGLAWRRAKFRPGVMAILVVVALAAITYGVVPWYFITYRGLENGGGG